MKRLLLLVTFLNSIIFMMLTPIWHGPDEQAHFGQVQNIAETGKAYRKEMDDLSQEILITETLLGTLRDKTGKNLYTHRPWFNIDYTDSTIGKDEKLINNLPRSYRTTFVKRESTAYPPLFYYISAIFYRLTYSQNFINRLMFTRLASVIMGTLTIYFALKLSNLVFGKNKLAAITATILVSFQPMFSFLTASVNSDNLMNLLFTIFIYLSALVIKQGKFSLKTITAILITLFALKFTKPHYVIALPILFSIVFFIRPKVKNKIRALLFLFLALIYIKLLVPSLPSPEIRLIESLTLPNFPHVTITEHINWTLRHTIAEVVPWYWGVFKWLSVALPRIVNRIINRLLIVSVFGLFVWFIRLIKNFKWQLHQKLIFFLLSASAIYFIVIMFWDWLFRRDHAFSFGMQGRYYFPLISAHMILLTLGLSQFLKKHLIKTLGLSAILLNFVGIHTLAKSYYSFSSFHTFFMQLSQYKPLYFKYPYSLIWIITYLIVLILFITKYLTYANLKTNRT